MPHGVVVIFGEAALSEDELKQRDVLFIKFHVRDIIDDRPHDDNDNGEGDEEFCTEGPPQTTESLSIPCQQISNKTELLANVSEVLTSLNLPSWLVVEYAEKIYSKAVLIECESREMIRPILVNITFITFIFSDDEDTDELTRQVGDLYLSVPASKSSIKALEKVEGSGLEENCSICFLDFLTDPELARMPCSHLFHKKCIVEWLEKSHLCPMCRFEMPVDPNLNVCPSCRQRLAEDASQSENSEDASRSEN